MMKYLLALFTDFEIFGNIIWLALPLFFFMLFTLKKRTRGERALLFAVPLFYVFIAIATKGYSRHIFTLYPFLLGVIFLVGWEIIGSKKNAIQIAAFLIISIACATNILIYRNTLIVWMTGNKLTAKKQHFPHALMKYINENMNDIDSHSPVLVLDTSYHYFYHAKKKGISFGANQMAVFHTAPSKERALDILRNQLHVKYFFIQWNYPIAGYIIDIISEDCDLVFQDRYSGYFLYRIRDRNLKKEELEIYFPNNSLLRNGSFENWSRDALAPPLFFEKGDHILPGMVSREESDVRVGKYAAKIIGDNFNFVQLLPDPEKLRGKTIAGFVWMKTKVANKYRVELFDEKRSSFSDRHSGSGHWELLQVNHAVDSAARTMTIRIVQAEKTGGLNDAVLVDGALAVEGDWNTFYIYASSIDKTKPQ